MCRFRFVMQTTRYMPATKKDAGGNIRSEG